jgi:uncharacterized protein
VLCILCLTGAKAEAAATASKFLRERIFSMRSFNHDVFMKLEPLQLHHRDLLVPRFQKLAQHLSEYTFAFCYLYRHQAKMQLYFHEEFFIKGVTVDGQPFLMPTFDIRSVKLDLLRDVMKDGSLLFPVPEEWCEGLPRDEFLFESLHENEDYVFSTEKLCTLSGRRLSSRRNLIKQFTSHYNAEAKLLTKELLKDAFFVLETWKNSAHEDISDTDYKICLEALCLHKELGLEAIVYYVEGKPIAFVIGEPLSHEMYVIHFEKADHHYKGVYQYINQAFAQSLAPNFVFLNWEEDLGKPGLRQAKSAYEPDFFVKKMRVRRM